MKNKILLAIADGVGDRPCEILDWNTPLQYARTSNLDQLAANGSCGIMDLYHAGIPVGTDLGHLILFGYGLEDYPGRGPIEAFGDGMELIGGDIAFRCNFATVDHQGLISDRRAGRIRLGTDELAAALNASSSTIRTTPSRTGFWTAFANTTAKCRPTMTPAARISPSARTAT